MYAIFVLFLFCIVFCQKVIKYVFDRREDRFNRFVLVANRIQKKIGKRTKTIFGHFLLLFMLYGRDRRFKNFPDSGQRTVTRFFCMVISFFYLFLVDNRGLLKKPRLPNFFYHIEQRSAF